MKIHLIIIFFLFFTSCSTNKKIVGTYLYEYQEKTRLILKPDSTFTFIKINTNPYLYTTDHPDERFFITEGRWWSLKKRIYLNSSTDSLTYNIINIEQRPAENPNYSTFRFYDMYNDSVGFGAVTSPGNKYTVIPAKKIFYYFDEDLRKMRSLEFVFYGYKPWKYTSLDTFNYDIRIHFKPEYRANYFSQTLFSKKGRMLIERGNTEKYRFRKQQ